jgi:ADP-ribose pyrophosphatase YjhB (NUDIX family)
MAELIDRIDAVATVAYCGHELLTVHNRHWGAFTLPMTKLRNWESGVVGNPPRRERGAEAALRNVAEFVGTTTTQTPGLLLDVSDLRQSDRTGEVNHYHVQIYGFELSGRRVAAGVVADWLTPNEILDASRHPVSPTARALVAKLLEAAMTKDRGGNFPPVPTPTIRESVASIAVIRHDRDSRPHWLCQWNQHWERYFLVGGHKDDSESPEECLVREMREELHLNRHQDYNIQRCRPHGYPGWSTRAWQRTQYNITTFDAMLTDRALAAVGRDAANRWLTAEEICSERCADGQLVSPTVYALLWGLGELG